MKKIAIATLALAAIAAQATEITVSEVRDFRLKSDGVRVTAPLSSIAGFTPQLSVTEINKQYVRFGVGGEYALTNIGPVAVALTGTGLYQDTHRGASGYGLTFGAKATVPVTKSVDVVASTERFVGQARESKFDGNTGTIGLNIKF
jgi:hypothetical protein